MYPIRTEPYTSALDGSFQARLSGDQAALLFASAVSSKPLTTGIAPCFIPPTSRSFALLCGLHTNHTGYMGKKENER